MIGKIFFAALLLCASTVASADGDIIIDIDGNSEDTSDALARGSDGRLYVNLRATSPRMHEITLLAFDADGFPITPFGTGGKVVGAPGGSIAVRPDGFIITGGDRVSTFDVTGTPVGSYFACGIFYPCYYGDVDRMRVYANTLLPLADGRAFAGGGHEFRLTSDRWTMVRINADGSKDTAWAGNEDGWIERNGSPSNEIAQLRHLSSTQFIALGWARFTGEMALSRFNLDGSTDFAFGINGVVAIGTSSVLQDPNYPRSARYVPLGVDHSQRILTSGATSFVARRLSDGSIDNSYTQVTPDPQTHYLTFVVDSLDRVVVFGRRGTSAYVARLLPDGGLDPSFGTAGEVTFTSSAAGVSNLQLTDGLVDANDRPVLYFTVTGASGSADVGLARLTTGGAVDPVFGAGIPDADVYPDAFSFISNTAPYGTANVVSAPVTITGINAPTSVSISGLLGRGYSIGCTGVFAQSAGLINPGQSICLRHSLPSTPGTSVLTTVVVGGRQATYATTATTLPADVIPDPFTFIDQTGAAPGEQVISAPITITGLTGSAPIAIDFGQYSLDCTSGYRSTPGTVTNGQTVCVRVTASASFSTPVSAVLGIGGVSDTFTVTTVAADTTPGAFTYPSVSNVATGVSVTSATISITEINSPAPVTVMNGEYAVNCGTYSTQPGTISIGQFLCLRHTSSSQPGTAVTTTVSVGGYTTTFSSTTAAAQSGGGGGGGGGAMTMRDLVLLALLLACQRVWPRLQVRRRRILG